MSITKFFTSSLLKRFSTTFFTWHLVFSPISLSSSKIAVVMERLLKSHFHRSTIGLPSMLFGFFWYDKGHAEKDILDFRIRMVSVSKKFLQKDVREALWSFRFQLDPYSAESVTLDCRPTIESTVSEILVMRSLSQYIMTWKCF